MINGLNNIKIKAEVASILKILILRIIDIPIAMQENIVEARRTEGENPVIEAYNQIKHRISTIFKMRRSFFPLRKDNIKFNT